MIHSLKTHCFDCVKQLYRLRVIFYLREFCSLDTNSIEFLMSWSNRCYKSVWIYYYYYIYNEKSQNANDEQLYMIERELAKVMLNSEQKVIIIKDFNAHYSWWNAKISNFIRMKALINWVNLHKCNLINTSNIDTYHSYSSQLSSILHLAFASKNMRNHIKNWHINENANTEFDHEVILFTIVMKKMIFFYFFIKCMQSMTMTLSRRCVYAKLHVI